MKATKRILAVLLSALIALALCAVPAGALSADELPFGVPWVTGEGGVNLQDLNGLLPENTSFTVTPLDSPVPGGYNGEGSVIASWEITITADGNVIDRLQPNNYVGLFFPAEGLGFKEQRPIPKNINVYHNGIRVWSGIGVWEVDGTAYIWAQVNSFGVFEIVDEPALLDAPAVTIHDINGQSVYGQKLSITITRIPDGTVMEICGNPSSLWGFFLYEYWFVFNHNPYRDYIVGGGEDLQFILDEDKDTMLTRHPQISLWSGDLLEGYVCVGFATEPGGPVVYAVDQPLAFEDAPSDLYCVWEEIPDTDTDDGSGSAAPWWESLPGFLQALLRFIAFGWLWMK